MTPITAKGATASTAALRQERSTSEWVTAASARSAPATGLHAALSAASTAVAAVLAARALAAAPPVPPPLAAAPRPTPRTRPSASVASAASAALTPSAKVTRPLHTSPRAASANQTAPQRAAAP